MKRSASMLMCAAISWSKSDWARLRLKK